MANEGDFSRKVQAWLFGRGWWVVKFYVHPIFSPQGTPDLLACYRGYFVAIELKASPKEKLSEDQRMKGNLIRLSGGIFLRLDPTEFPDKLIQVEKLVRKRARVGKSDAKRPVGRS